MANFIEILQDIINVKYPDIVVKHAEVMDAVAIDHVSRTSGDGSPGSTDVYTLWKDVAETVEVGSFSVYNGKDGRASSDSGDMLKSVYDPDGIEADAFDADNMKDGLSKVIMTALERDKLQSIQPGAEVNAVDSVAGKTGAVVLDKNDVGLGNVDNTSDADKPISNAVAVALGGKADVGHQHEAGDISDFQPTVSQNPDLLKLLGIIKDTGDGSLFLADDGNYKQVTGSGGATTFDDLTDTPATKIAGKYVKVSADGQTLEYADGSGPVNIDGIATVNTVFDMADIASPTHDDIVYVKRYWPDHETGGGFFRYNANKSVLLHNAGNIIRNRNFADTVITGESLGTGDGTTTTFTTANGDIVPFSWTVYVDGVVQKWKDDFYIHAGTQNVVFHTPPADGSVITIDYKTNSATGVWERIGYSVRNSKGTHFGAIDTVNPHKYAGNYPNLLTIDQLSSKFTTLDEAKAWYFHVDDLDNLISWAALQAYGWAMVIGEETVGFTNQSNGNVLDIDGSFVIDRQVDLITHNIHVQTRKRGILERYDNTTGIIMVCRQSYWGTVDDNVYALKMYSRGWDAEQIGFTGYYPNGDHYNLQGLKLQDFTLYAVTMDDPYTGDGTNYHYCCGVRIKSTSFFSIRDCQFENFYDQIQTSGILMLAEIKGCNFFGPDRDAIMFPYTIGDFSTTIRIKDIEISGQGRYGIFAMDSGTGFFWDIADIDIEGGSTKAPDNWFMTGVRAPLFVVGQDNSIFYNVRFENNGGFVDAVIGGMAPKIIGGNISKIMGFAYSEYTQEFIDRRNNPKYNESDVTNIRNAYATTSSTNTRASLLRNMTVFQSDYGCKIYVIDKYGNSREAQYVSFNSNFKLYVRDPLDDTQSGTLWNPTLLDWDNQNSTWRDLTDTERTVIFDNRKINIANQLVLWRGDPINTNYYKQFGFKFLPQNFLKDSRWYGTNRWGIDDLPPLDSSSNIAAYNKRHIITKRYDESGNKVEPFYQEIWGMSRTTRKIRLHQYFELIDDPVYIHPRCQSEYEPSKIDYQPFDICFFDRAVTFNGSTKSFIGAICIESGGYYELNYWQRETAYDVGDQVRAFSRGGWDRGEYILECTVAGTTAVNEPVDKPIHFGDTFTDGTVTWKFIKWASGKWKPFGEIVHGNDSGTTANRPTSVPTGFRYFDTDLGKPIFWSGTQWVDANGTAV